MEEKQLNEQESLELITRMIQNSKKNLGQGGGNAFLLWGYVCAITALVVFVMAYFTKQLAWNWLWVAIPVVGFPLSVWQGRKRPPRVVTYLDKVIASVWRNLSLFGICGVWVVLVVYAIMDGQTSNMILLIPMSLLFCSMGSMITGSLLKDVWMQISGAVSLILSFYLLIDILGGAMFSFGSPSFYFDVLHTYLLYALCFVFLMIIPGYRINSKGKKDAYV
jgi:hypothetical protein